MRKNKKKNKRSGNEQFNKNVKYSRNDYSFEKSRFFGSPEDFAEYLCIISYENIIRYHDGKLGNVQEQVYNRHGLYLIHKLAIAFWKNKTLWGDRLHLEGYCPYDDSFEYAFRDTDGCYSDMQTVRIKVFLRNDKPAYGMMLPDTDPGKWRYYNTAEEVAYCASVAMNIPDLRHVSVTEYEGETVEHDMRVFAAMAALKDIRENESVMMNDDDFEYEN